jgi:hypothetical protein
MAKFNTGQSFADGDTVTGAKLNNIIGLLDIYSGVIADQTSIAATVSTADLLLIADTDAGSSGAANKVTIQKLLNDTLTGGTFTNANIAEQLTYGTATGNRTVSTNAVITNGTITTALIPTGTFGTTTSTAATITNGTITTGLIPTLTAGTTTGTAGIFTSGTVATLNSTTGTIATFNSTTGTIGNLSTTLAGDFTISQGTGTLATSGVTLGTYGDATSYPIVAVNAKGLVTSVSTAAGGGSVGTNSIYFDALSTSTSESTNVASRVAKGWASWNGSTDVIRSSFNVHSISHGATGEYTVNFNTSIGTGMAFSADGNLSSSFNYVVVTDISSATSLRVIASTAGAVKTNLDFISVLVFGA